MAGHAVIARGVEALRGEPKAPEAQPGRAQEPPPSMSDDAASKPEPKPQGPAAPEEPQPAPSPQAETRRPEPGLPNRQQSSSEGEIPYPEEISPRARGFESLQDMMRRGGRTRAAPAAAPEEISAAPRPQEAASTPKPEPAKEGEPQAAPPPSAVEAARREVEPHVDAAAGALREMDGEGMKPDEFFAEKKSPIDPIAEDFARYLYDAGIDPSDRAEIDEAVQYYAADRASGVVRGREGEASEASARPPEEAPRSAAAAPQTPSTIETLASGNVRQKDWPAALGFKSASDPGYKAEIQRALDAGLLRRNAAGEIRRAPRSDVQAALSSSETGSLIRPISAEHGVYLDEKSNKVFVEGAPRDSYIRDIAEGAEDLPSAAELREKVEATKSGNERYNASLGITPEITAEIRRLNRIADTAGGQPADEAIERLREIQDRLPEEKFELDIADEYELKQLASEFSAIERAPDESDAAYMDGIARVLKRYVADFAKRGPIFEGCIPKSVSGG